MYQLRQRASPEALHGSLSGGVAGVHIVIIAQYLCLCHCLR